MRNLSVRLQLVREEERKVIAREIHDELGQLLTTLKMGLSRLGRTTDQGKEPLLEKAKALIDLVDMTIQSVKRISTDLRPAILDDLGLLAAIEWQAEEFQDRSGIKCEVSTGSKDVALEQEHAIAVFRIFQEALTNIARHANATRVKVSLKEKGDKLLLQIRDNGKGITEEQVHSSRSLGLIGMRERAHSLGGELDIKGIPDKGTTIKVTVPLHHNG